MNTVNVVIHAIGWTLIHSLWIGALAAAVYALAAARLRNRAPQSAYGWGLVCLLALAVSLVGMFVHEFDIAQANADERAIAIAYAELPTEISSTSVVASVEAPASLTQWIEPWLPAMVLIWGLAVLAIGSGVARSHLALRRLVGAGVSLPHLAAPVLELADAFGVTRSIAVVSSAVARVPFVIGHFAPVIVLPMTIAAGMPWPQLRLILAHEIAHLRRADYLVNWMQLAIEVLLFFHPAVRWLSEEMRSLREACCDDLVVDFAGGRADYTRALLSLEEFRHDAPLLAPSAVAGGLLWRVQRMAGRVPKQSDALQKLMFPVVVLSIFATLVGGGVQLSPGTGTRDFILPRVAMLATSTDIGTPQLSLGEWAPQYSDAVPAPVLWTPALMPVVVPLSSVPIQMEVRPAAVELESPVLNLSMLGVPRLAETSSAQDKLVTAIPGTTAFPELLPISSTAPAYPRNQRARTDEIGVELSFALDTQGRVIDIQSPQVPRGDRAFVESAQAALASWRYGPNAVAQLGDGRLQHRFVFRDGTRTESQTCNLVTGTKLCVVSQTARADASESGRCQATTGSRLCRR